MQRLLKDAEAISGIKYDISSFADVTEAIHVMQEEMGIAGTTAKEASGTIQGSLGMLKGAWSNLMTGLSDPEADLSSLINNVFSSVTTFAGNLVPRISQVLSGIATAFTQLVPLLTNEIPNLFNQVLPPLIEGAVALVNGLVAAMPSVVQAIMGALPALIDGVLQLITSLATALPQIIQPIVAALPQIVQSIVQALPVLIPALVDGLVALIMALIGVLPQIIQPIIDALPTIIVAITDALLTNLPVLISGVGQLIVALAAAIPQVLGALWEAIKGIFVLLGQKILGFFEPVKNAISNAWNAMGNVPGLAQMKTMIENVWKAIKDYITTYINAVKNIVTTVWNSIKNVISTVLNSIKNVITTAWNAVKTIISNVMKLISSVLKGDWEGVKKAISNILNAIKSVIKSIWDGIKNTISSVLNGIKNVVSSVWNGIKSVISSYLNMIKTTVSSVWNGIKGAISNVLKGIVNTVKGGAKDMLSAGKDLVKGLWNGINNAKDWVLGKIKGFGKGILNGLKSFFGIKSPSRVMRDQVGRELANGVAVGITANADKAESASEKLAKNILDAAQNKLDTFKTFNDMTLAEEAGFWDAVRVQLKEGTDARLQADQKYFEAKKSINEEVVEAEKTLQDSLAEIYQKLADRKSEILGTFSLFDEYTDGNATPKTQVEMLNALDSQIAALEVYDDAMATLEARIGGSALFEELAGMGIGALSQIQQINSMTDIQLQMYADKYAKRAELASKMAEDELSAETFEATQKAYQTFADACGVLGVEVVSETSAMQQGVTNALDKIKQAFETFQPKMKMPHFKIEGTLDIEAGSVPSVAVEWYKKAMSNAAILNKPTIFGYSAASGKYLGAGEAGNEVVAGEQTLMQMIQGAVATQNNGIVAWLQRVFEILAQYFPQMLDALEAPMAFDSNSMAAALAVPMNRELGKISSRKERGR
jgi:phage-related protein